MHSLSNFHICKKKVSVSQITCKLYFIMSFNSPLKDFLGAAECTLGSIVGEFGGRLQKPLM